MTYSNEIYETHPLFKKYKISINYDSLDDNNIIIGIVNESNSSVKSIILSTEQTVELAANLLSLVAHLRTKEIKE